MEGGSAKTWYRLVCALEDEVRTKLPAPLSVYGWYGHGLSRETLTTGVSDGVG